VQNSYNVTVMDNLNRGASPPATTSSENQNPSWEEASRQGDLQDLVREGVGRMIVTDLAMPCRTHTSRATRAASPRASSSSR